MKRERVRKKEIIKALAIKTGMPQAKADRIVNTLFTIIGNMLSAGYDVPFNGFGRFYTRLYPGRTVITPQGEHTEIPGRIIPAFKPSEALKKQIRENSERL